MNKNGKFYPDGVIYHKSNDCWHQTYRGTAAAILLQEDVENLKGITDSLYDERMPEEMEGVIEQVQAHIDAMVDGAIDRMRKMHLLLGAYDMGEDGQISKPASEKIDWSKHQSPNAPKLELVRKDT